MGITLINYAAIGLADAPDEIHIGDDGIITAAVSATGKTIDCGGQYLSPGWCDLHVHIWHGGTDISVRVVDAGRAFGVTAMADAGSAGEANFLGLREYVIDPAAETVRAFLNIGSIGLIACNRVSELIDLRSIDLDRTFDVIDANRDIICGVKVRASAAIVGTWGIAPAKIAKRVAEIAGLPLMVHVGKPPPLIDEVFDILGPGDIVTHCFNGKKAGSITDTPAIIEQARRLADQGVVMDIGHGAASFDFEVARAAIATGFLPDTISTDLHRNNIDGPVHDLSLTASKLMAVGLSLDDCIHALTHRPRTILGLPGQGAAAPGRRADFTIFDVGEGPETAIDSTGNTLRLDQLLTPRMTVIGASVAPASRRSVCPPPC